MSPRVLGLEPRPARVLGLDMSTVAIYALVDPRSSTVRYIGKTVDPTKRMGAHLSVRELRKNNRRTAWIKSLLRAGVRPVMQVLLWVSVEDWILAECMFIEYYLQAGFDLVNGTEGGEGPAGWKHSEESKAKIRAGMAKAFAEGRTNSRLGSKFTDEQRQRLSESHKGGPGFRGKHTEATKQKLRAARARQEASGKNPWLVHGGKA